jgi:peptide/nickel transport system substrate-binding protein
MLLRRLHLVAVTTLLAFVLASCGQAAAPTAAPPIPTPTTAGPTSPGPAATPTPAATAKADAPQAASSGYPPEKTKELISQNMYLPGMSYGRGETPKYGGTARFSNKAELPNDDPTLTSSITSINVLGPLHGNGWLVATKREANAEVRPHFAESWSLSQDSKTWTFKLRPDVKWHDGATLVAEDIKFAIDLAVWPPKGRRVGGAFTQLDTLAEVQVVDQRTVRLVFAEPSPHLMEALSSPNNAIIHKRDPAQKELDKGNLTVGLASLGWTSLGPFKFDRYVRGGEFRVVRFDQYFEKDAAGRAMPYLDSVVNTPIPDRAVALGAFRAGRLEAMSRGVGTSLDPQEVVLVKRTFGEKVWFHRYPYLAYGIAMNSLKPPFDDVRARRAVTLYLDRDEGASKMQGGFAFSSGFLSPASWWHSYQYVEWPGFNQKTKIQDQGEAKRLMQEAALAGSPVSISCRSDFLYMCEFSESVLRGVGFVPKIELLDVNAVRETTENMRHQTYMGGPGNGLLPSNILSGWVSSNKRSGNQTNDLKFDEWDRIIRTSTDPLVRRAALWEAEKHMLLDKAYNAPFLREEVVAPYRTYLKGSVVPGYQAHDNSDRSTDWIDQSLK